LGKRSPSYTISDPGYFTLAGAGHQWRDWKKGGHGAVDLHKSLVISCDTYYYGLAHELTIDNIFSFISQFGFGKRTGIDIDGEGAGILPSQEWKMRRFKQKWYPGETISVGIGQGYNSYTPLQLANATATVANNGVMFRPHLVNYVEEANTRQRTPVEPKPLRTLDVKPEHIAFVKRAMVGVNKEGTGARAFAGAPYTHAGKTGTAQVIGMRQGEKYVESRVAERFRDHALFIAYAPADKPTIALAVIVENGGFGARAAAPIARQVFDYYLLGKEPQQPAKEDDDAS
jgi:penicillin-binding protein 2